MLQLAISIVPFVLFAIGAVLSTIFAATGLLTLILLTAAAYTEYQRRRIEREFPPQGRFVEAQGPKGRTVRMHVLERGETHKGQGQEQGEDNGGAPIVLIHGAASNADDMMVSAGEALGAAFPGRRIVAIDRPGHGYSERPDTRDAASSIFQAHVIADVMSEMGLEDALVVGHSWGGCAALTLALRHPEKVRAQVLLAPVTHPWRGKISWYWRLGANPWFGPMFYRTLVMPVGISSIRPTLRYTFAPNAVPEDYLERAGINRIFRPNNFRANSEDMVDLWDNVNWLTSQYETIEAPTIVLQGEDDPTLWTALHAESLVRQMPDARLAVLPGVGHLPNYFAKDDLVAAVRDLDARGRAQAPVGETTRQVA